MKKTVLMVLYVAAIPLLWIGVASLIFMAGSQLWGHPSIPRMAYVYQWLEYRQDFGRNAITSFWLVISGVLTAALLITPPIKYFQWRGGSKKNSSAKRPG